MLRTLPIIMLTSFNEPPYRIRAEQVGVSRFMAAPFDRHELLTTVRTLLDRREVAGPAGPLSGDRPLPVNCPSASCARGVLALAARRLPGRGRRPEPAPGRGAGAGAGAGRAVARHWQAGADRGRHNSWEPVYHAVIGARMLCRFRRPTPCAVVRSHHEHLNGTGGPDGLAGEDLALPVRIVAICNRFDRLTGGTPGRQRKAREGLEALKIEVDAGLWDPRVAEHLREVVLRSARLSEAVAAAGRR